MVKIFSIFILNLLVIATNAQELFSHSEPASSIPKNVLGVRLFGESYKEHETRRNMAAIRLMYGLTSKFSLMITGSISNHHADSLAPNLITHRHMGPQTIYYTDSTIRGLEYPYRLGGIHIYGKYRFLTHDKQNEHFRMAAYAEYSYLHVAHDESEPTLLDDTKGYGVGLIATYLKKHFTVSLTAGIIIPGEYSETVHDFNGGLQNTIIRYGDAFKYNLSFGYLLYPNKYKSYKEININAYVEFLGKSFGDAKINQNGNEVIPETELLLAGHYVEVHPALQFIFNSNLRVDLSVGFPLINKSLARFYPIYSVGIQRYFFF